jgi:hypothetical protein
VSEPPQSGVEPLLTRENLAAIYDVPVSTVDAWRRKGEIPSGFLVGKHLRWHPETIRQDLARRAGLTETVCPAVAG